MIREKGGDKQRSILCGRAVNGLETAATLRNHRVCLVKGVAE